MSLKVAEKIFTVTALLFYTGALIWCIPRSSSASVIKDIGPYVAVVTALLLLSSDWKRATCLISKNLLLFGLVLLVLVSVLWSNFPMITIFLTMPLLRVTIFAIYFGTRFSLREQIQLLTCVFGIAAILSIVFAIAIPKYGIVGLGFIANSQDLTHIGSWRGIYIHKTILGTMMTLGILCSLFCWFIQRKYRIILLINLFLCTIALLGSTTKGAIAVMAIVLALIPFSKALRWHFKLKVCFFSLTIVLIGCTAFFLVGNAEQALGILGRDITISGRTNYWPLMLNKIWERPWFGYGYETFWLDGWKGEPASIWRLLADEDEPPHAHNGFLNLWFDIGLVGLITFALGYIINCWRAIAWIQAVKTVEGLVPLAFLAALLLFNLTESFLVRPDIFWLFYVSMSLAICSNIQSSKAEVNKIVFQNGDSS